MRYLQSCLFMVVLAAVAPCASALTINAASEWLDLLLKSREQLLTKAENERGQEVVRLWRHLERSFPIYSDWLLQDAFEEGLWTHAPTGGQEQFRMQGELIGNVLAELLIGLNTAQWRTMLLRVTRELTAGGRTLPDTLTAIDFITEDRSDYEWAALYLAACTARRAYRLETLMNRDWDGIVFARHHNLGASHYAYTEALSDAQNERHFYPGSALNVLRWNGNGFEAETLIDDPNGVIRDVDVSWDGQTILFSWKRSDRDDDFSLYSMDMATRAIQPVTGDLGHADYEAAWLPNGDIVFNSTRCVQIVDCWWTEVSNLYACAADGRYLRRLSFDQVHTNYPTVTDDGRVLYTRWDYNDRGQLYPQGLFEMFPDGTGQREFYGNNSWFPTTILHARGIPGTTRILAVFTGHHTWQAGKLGILGPSLGRQENEGAQLIAPIRETPAERIDHYGQEGDLFKYPYPLDERHFLVSYAPRGWEQRGPLTQALRPVFGLYFMDLDGRRELLYLDTERQISVGRMVPLAARPTPAARPGMVDYLSDTGVYYVQDIYAGLALEGVPRGEVKALRVIALDYRAAGIGDNRNSGVAGAALVSTPIAIENGSWDVKIPLGRATVYEDGSALFTVPARMPLYFQALDAQGRAIQSMRSWNTLQPGESRSCVGCHDDKNIAPPVLGEPTLAMRAGAQVLESSYGPARGFSFNERIQPILDRHCIRCHDGTPNNDDAKNGEATKAFSLLATPREDEKAKRFWSDAYLRLTSGGPHDGPVRWISAQSAPPLYPPWHTGAARSPLIEMLDAGHNDIRLTPEELETLACWIDMAVPYCGDYTEANAWTDEEQAKYAHFLKKRTDMEAVEAENIRAYIQDRQQR